MSGSLFWSGGTLLCFIIFPVLRFVSPTKDICHQRARFFNHYTFKIFLWFGCLWGIIKLQKTNLEKLKDQRGVLLICNHPSLVDTVIIMAHFKRIQCIVKGDLWTHPILGGIVRTAGYIPNDLSPDLFLKTCKEELQKGENILIFPEGTRTVAGKPLKLKRGLSNLSIETNANIQALTLSCSSPTLTKEAKWYILPQKQTIFHLKAGCLFEIGNYKPDVPRSLRSRALTKDIQDYYNRYLGYD